VYDQEKTKHESLLERHKRAQEYIKALESHRDRLIDTLKLSAPDHSLLHNSKSNSIPSRVCKNDRADRVMHPCR